MQSSLEPFSRLAHLPTQIRWGIPGAIFALVLAKTWEWSSTYRLGRKLVLDGAPVSYAYGQAGPIRTEFQVWARNTGNKDVTVTRAFWELNTEIRDEIITNFGRPFRKVIGSRSEEIYWDCHELYLNAEQLPAQLRGRPCIEIIRPIPFWMRRNLKNSRKVITGKYRLVAITG